MPRTRGGGSDAEFLHAPRLPRTRPPECGHGIRALYEHCKTGTYEDAQRDVIAMWIEGGRDGRREVVNYCENDVGVLAMVASAICARRKVVCTTKEYMYKSPNW